MTDLAPDHMPSNVRLTYPDGRTVPLELHYEGLDVGHLITTDQGTIRVEDTHLWAVTLNPETMADVQQGRASLECDTWPPMCSIALR